MGFIVEGQDWVSLCKLPQSHQVDSEKQASDRVQHAFVIKQVLGIIDGTDLK